MTAGMISVVKEICIFMIIAQAILFFVPGSSYGKYVRLLVGIMMILRLTQPLFQLLTDEEERREIAERAAGLEAMLSAESQVPLMEDNAVLIEKGIEEELKKRLRGCDSGYEIAQVSLDQEEERVVITLSEKKMEGTDGEEIRIEPIRLKANEREEGVMPEGDAERERLRELYGDALGVEAGRIEIVVE